MLHQLPIEQLGARGEAMASAVQACVHCGFCLPTCPTYRELGEEMDSPRGRILLMKQVLEGKLEADAAQKHIDRCLGCLACETSCPSGVRYGELLSPYRARRRGEGTVGGNRLPRWLAALTLPYPGRFRWAVRMGKLGKAFAFFTPKSLKPMLDLVPTKVPSPIPLSGVYPAVGARKARVGLLLGCAQQVLAPNINAAAVRVLTRNGIEVVIPSKQGCCGALSWHIGDDRAAQAFAENNVKAFNDGLDYVVTTAAGCGSGLHDYRLIMAGTKFSEAAEKLAAKTVDVSVLLDRFGFEPPRETTKPIRVAYHDACHLAHAQKVRQAPRRLLRSIPGLTLLEIADSEICCGSAGTYNLDQPEIAASLGRKKAERIIATGADVLVLGNIGCSVQIERYLREAGSIMPVLHTIELLNSVSVKSLV